MYLLKLNQRFTKMIDYISETVLGLLMTVLILIAMYYYFCTGWEKPKPPKPPRKSLWPRKSLHKYWGDGVSPDPPSSTPHPPRGGSGVRPKGGPK